MVMQLAAKETLRCADIVEEMFVNLHECIDKNGKNIENELVILVSALTVNLAHTMNSMPQGSGALASRMFF